MEGDPCPCAGTTRGVCRQQRWDSLPALAGRADASVLEPHPLQELGPPQVAMERSEARAGQQNPPEPRVPLRVRTLQPVERRVRLAARTMDFRDLEGGALSVPFNHLAQR